MSKRKCKYNDRNCTNNNRGYCKDEDYEVSGVCPYEEGEVKD